MRLFKTIGMLWLLSAGLIADEPLTIEQMKNIAYTPLASGESKGQVMREFHKYLDGFNEIFQDNRDASCCPVLGEESVSDNHILSLCKHIQKGAENEGFVVKDFRVFFKNNTPLNFNVSFREKGDSENAETCCIEGDIKNNKVVFSDHVGYRKFPEDDSEEMGITRTSNVFSTRWRTKYDADEKFLNKVKATSAFYKDDTLYYLANMKDEVKIYSIETYNFDSEKPLFVWSNEAKKVFDAYIQKDICRNISQMIVYKEWMVLSTWCKMPDGSCCEENSGNDSSVYLKRINHKWVIVWDCMLSEDPECPFNYKTLKYNCKGIKAKDLPKQLTAIKGI